MAPAPNILPVAATAQVKAKKRKTVDFDLLVQRDIKALLEKKATQGTQPRCRLQNKYLSAFRRFFATCY